MKYIFLLMVIGLFGLSTFGQHRLETDGTDNEVYTEVLSKNNFDISVIQVFPQNFPEVSVVFQAKNELGEPLWLLDKDDFYVRENAYECEILDVRNISENEPLNLALVLDHSGSMIEDPAQITDTSVSYQDLYHEGLLPEGYIMPITHAKEAILNFFNVENQSQDSMFFVGFSETVDRIPPITNDFDRFSGIVKNVEPGGYTAFYDAVYNAIDSLKNHSSQPVVIALTDGGDNSSEHTYDELIKHAQEQEVPIYIIGLGHVDSYSLEYICEQTNGFYYHTTDPSKLTEIYENIKKQLRSIYELDYVSNEDNSDNALRRIKFYFTNDTLNFNDNEYEFELPEEVVVHLEERHEEMRQKQKELEEQEASEQQMMIIGGSVAGLFLLGVGAFMVIRRRKKSSNPTILKAFPNPFQDQINLNYTLPAGSSGVIYVQNMSGGTVFESSVSAGTLEQVLDLSTLESGTYLISIKTESSSSNVMKVIKN